MAKILDGKKAAEMFRIHLQEKFLQLQQAPCLAIIHCNDPASLSYLKGRKKILASLNAILKEFIIDSQMTPEDLKVLIQNLNQDKSIDGIMIDRPLPAGFNEEEMISYIDPSKDIDGYTPSCLGNLVCNHAQYLACTPAAAIALLDFYKIPLEGKDVVVIGRSVNVGKPLALMLLNRNATVTIAHSKTNNLAKITKKADIIFVCVGKANFLKKEQISRKSILIDIGINFDENGKLCGDVAKECYTYAKAYSPVPGGVGVMTNLILMNNLLLAHQHHQ